MSHDYFTDVLATFLDLYLALRSTEGQRALRFYKNILICVLKMNWNDMRVINDIILGELTL